MKILIINCGSSSLKYQLMDMDNETIIGKGLVERIGIPGSRIIHEVEGMNDYIVEASMNDHKEAIKYVFDAITDEKHGIVKSLDEISGIGHRVLHGGEKLSEPVIVTDEVKEIIKENIKFGPLHNPGNLMGIEACEEIVPGKPNVAVFDTAFHQTMPDYIYMYPIPYEYYKKYAIRKYGFHGTSHKYISYRLPEVMGVGREEINFVSCHLGNGSSLAAIRKGKCYDTSMGLTPLEGLEMGTRSGNIDPTVVTFIMEEENLTPQQMNTILNKESGALGVSGLSSDFRDLEDAADEGNERAKLALDMFVIRVKRFLGAYIAELDGCDAIAFTGGIGENSKTIRDMVCKDLEHIGIKIDPERNDIRGKEQLISTDDSKIKVYVVPTNEELMIARDTMNLIK
ncbi:MAG: acetate kinase [Tissierellia bacterium]|nr:acetate kinase [Tissierellia bacterium]